MCRTVRNNLISLSDQHSIYQILNCILIMQLHNEHHEFTSNVIELYTICRRPNTRTNLRNHQGKRHMMQHLVSNQTHCVHFFCVDRPIHRICCLPFSM